MLVLWVFSFFMQMFTKTHTHTIWTLWISKTPYKLSYMKKIVAWKDEVICPNSHDWITIQLEICFPGCTSGKEPACQCRRHERHKLDPWVRKIPWSRKWQLIPVFLPGKFHGQRSMAGYHTWGCKELDMTEKLNTYIATPTALYVTDSRWNIQCNVKAWSLKQAQEAG